MKANLLKAILIVQTIAVLVYTIVAFKNEGNQIFGIFLANLQSLTWNGQFNLDFSCYLLLSGLWIMWRNNFSTNAVVIAIAAMVVGIMVFAPYVLYLLVNTKGDLKKVLIGAQEGL